MRVYVVDNGGQWTHREWRVLKYLGAETKIVANDTRCSELDGLDGLVLSGGAPRVGVIRERWAGRGVLGLLRRAPSWESARDTSSWRSISGATRPRPRSRIREVHGGSPPARTSCSKACRIGSSVGVPQRRGHPAPAELRGPASSENCDIQAMRHRDRPSLACNSIQRSSTPSSGPTSSGTS